MERVPPEDAGIVKVEAGSRRYLDRLRWYSRCHVARCLGYHRRLDHWKGHCHRGLDGFYIENGYLDLHLACMKVEQETRRHFREVGIDFGNGEDSPNYLVEVVHRLEVETQRPPEMRTKERSHFST